MGRVALCIPLLFAAGCVIDLDPALLDGGRGLDAAMQDAPSADARDDGAIDATPCTDRSCCDGCWDALTGCQPGTEADACGAGGETCVTCVAGEDRCAEGICAPARVIASIAAGRESACAIDEEGGLFCWGSNLNGLLGVGSALPRISSPRQVMPGTAFVQAALGPSHAHGISTEPEPVLYGWGENYQSELGTGSTSPSVLRSPVPAVVDGHQPFIAVAAGGNESCGLRGTGGLGELWCWGNAYEFGIPFEPHETDENPRQLVPKRFGTDSDFIAVGFGTGFGCGLHAGGSENGRLECWGRNDFRQLGRDVPVDPSPLVPVGVGYTAIALGPEHACAIRKNRVVCWGRNELGECGQPPALEIVPDPTPVEPLRDVQAVAAGLNHTCALDVDGRVSCWGSNGVGQLGLGPARVGETGLGPTDLGLTAQRAVAAGRLFTLVLSGEGIVRGFGDSESEQLAAGTVNQPSPVVIDFP